MEFLTTPVAQSRLHEHRIAACEARDNDPFLHHCGLVFDISQHAGFARRPSILLPRPLTGNVLWYEKPAVDFCSDDEAPQRISRPLLPVEVWAAQGILHIYLV